jgi:hypothetical protein
VSGDADDDRQFAERVPFGGQGYEPARLPRTATTAGCSGP